MRRFLRDAVVALFVGAILVALAMVLRPSPDDDPSGTSPAPGQEAPRR